MQVYFFLEESKKDSHNSVQVQHVYESNFLFEKIPSHLKYTDLYVFDSLLKHHLTRCKIFALIRSCGKDVYKEVKSIEEA